MFAIVSRLSLFPSFHTCVPMSMLGHLDFSLQETNGFPCGPGGLDLHALCGWTMITHNVSEGP